VAGPISIFITSHGLKGRFGYCLTAAVGAAIVDFVYCFIAVFGFTQLYALYYPMIPYIFLVGSVFIFLVGIKIFRSHISYETLSQDVHISDKIKHHNGFWIGFMLNFLNPSLFFGWLISSVVILSFVSSMGFHLGGLETMIDNNARIIEQMDSNAGKFFSSSEPDIMNSDSVGIVKEGSTAVWAYFPVIISMCYAFCVALGTVIWFSSYSMFLVRNRHNLQVRSINGLIRILGFSMCGFGIYLGIKALTVLLK
jgi:hypothetical protein